MTGKVDLVKPVTAIIIADLVQNGRSMIQKERILEGARVLTDIVCGEGERLDKREKFYQYYRHYANSDKRMYAWKLYDRVEGLCDV